MYLHVECGSSMNTYTNGASKSIRTQMHSLYVHYNAHKCHELHIQTSHELHIQTSCTQMHSPYVHYNAHTCILCRPEHITKHHEGNCTFQLSMYLNDQCGGTYKRQILQYKTRMPTFSVNPSILEDSKKGSSMGWLRLVGYSKL